ncbi:DNA translocase FtsK [Ornithinibacillus sp. BX22]|uniref:DNA translocase FtsK n=1 Tax=Ornithinibacillus hominis TaxID=2763055 RepID=A0A923L924_9BACI|nr:DNA translocase FtsK [Ornithinibacillus hominis]MBC5638619.1 DNA translocase FtsK [Ornithinibacillus hominis]
MWDRWKKRIETFIWKEVEVEEEIDYQDDEYTPIQDSKPDIKTRMVYQYPYNNSYHIPQISNPNKEIRRSLGDIETPAYIRKGNRPNNAKQPMPQQADVAKTTKEKKPFERTDVPSPIYGFRERTNKEVNSIPAYVRKKRPTEVTTSDSHHNDEINANLNSSESSNLEVNHLPMQEAYEEISNPRPDLEETANLQEDKVEYKDIQEPEKVTQIADANHNNQESSSIPTSEGEKQRSVPYNVIMTPSDKRKILHKKVEYKQQPKVEVEHDSDNSSNHTTVPLHLLNDPVEKSNLNDQWIQEQQQLLEQTLKYFHVRAKVVNATQGPAVTRFEVQPELGVKVSKVKNLSDDLKLNMSAKDIRIEAPIPGKNTIGIEIPNPTSQMVGLSEIIGSNSFKDSSSPLSIALGLNIEGAPIVTNIQKMPHGLIAGATGSGKSVCINTILLSLIYKAHHDDVKFILIDPKMVELAPYNGIPHLVSPVITDVKAATAALKWAVNEMEERYEKFVQEGVRDIERYNQKVLKQGRGHEKMPFIVIVIDELADLMMVSPQDVEDAISRIAQKARACGIHLLLATQRPSVDVLTGLIKANIPTRIAFSVSSQVDSRTIIDTGGAEKLLGKGDMLFVENGAGKSVRLQGPFVSDEEIERVTSYVSSLAEPNYLFEQESLLKQFEADEEEDELLTEAIQFVYNHDSASTSLLQRHFKIGYNRAARLIDALEYKGIISGQNGSKPRDVLITKAELEELLS